MEDIDPLVVSELMEVLVATIFSISNNPFPYKAEIYLLHSFDKFPYSNRRNTISPSFKKNFFQKNVWKICGTNNFFSITQKNFFL